MDTTLLDAAFRLVSHSITCMDARFHSPTTDDARVAELQRRFSQSSPQALRLAIIQAQKLEEAAIEMAETARMQRQVQRELLLDVQELAERCPGFSSKSYSWAIQDGFTLSR